MKKIAVIGVPGGWSSERLADAVEAKTGYRQLVDMADVALDLETGQAKAGDLILNDLDGVIVKKISPVYSPDVIDRLELLRFLHEKGLKIFSNPYTILRLIDRLSCTISLRLGGIPMPATIITENVNEAHAAVKRFGRAVFKPLFTSKARGMTVIEDDPEARDLIEEYQGLGNPVMYIQQMVTHPGKDLGVTFLGGQYLATYARRGSGDSWNTTTNSGGKYVASEPSPEVMAVARQAHDLFRLDFTCVDVVETPEGPKVFEVSAFGGFRGLLDANGVDAAPLYAQHVIDRV